MAAIGSSKELVCLSKVLIEELAAGSSVDEFLESYSGVTREQIQIVLDHIARVG